MRVKTVPRQRILQKNNPEESINIASKLENGAESTSNDEEEETVKSTMDNHGDCGLSKFEQAENRFSNNEKNNNGGVIKCTNDVYKERARFEQSEECYSASDERKNESLDRTTEVLDMSTKCKVQSLRKNLLNHCLTAGPSGCKYSELYEKEEATRISRNDDDDKPNICCSAVGLSCGKHCRQFYEDNATSAPVNDNESSMKAINLCMKDCQERIEDVSARNSASADDKLKDTFLYKIMTDPSFLESIQKNKQLKKYICQFCKHDFATSDELADHMDVKMDESNQIRCCACKKTFAQKRYLRYHQRCHSERTKFTCDICTKKYTRLDNLTRHNAFHVNPDKFSCTYCEKTFARKDLLNKHLKCHDNKHRFFCTACQKYFKGPVSLDNHNRILHAFN